MTRGEAWERMYERRAASGEDVAGEARFLHGLAPRGSVLVAGCGTGRIPRQLAGLGHEVAGFDVDPEMIEVARARAPELDLRRDEVSIARYEREFDLVVMPANLLLFLASSRVPAAVANMARHVAPGGALVAGFALGKGVEVSVYDDLCTAAGLAAEARYATWQEAPFTPDAEYVVAVHRRP